MVVLTFLLGLMESRILNMRADDIISLYHGSTEILVRTLKGRKTEEAIQRGPQVYWVHGDKTDDRPLSVVRRCVKICGMESDFLVYPKKPFSGWINGGLKVLLQLEVFLLRWVAAMLFVTWYAPGSQTRITLGGSVVELL